MTRLLLTMLSLVLLSSAALAQVQVPPLVRPVEVITRPLEIEEGQVWQKTVDLPALAADEAPVLWLRARIPHGGGGGNFIIRLLVNGAPMRDNWFRPRLLNKLPHFDPPNTQYHFTWYRDSSWGNFSYSWFTVFDKNPTGNWAGTGQDYDYVFDLSGLVSGKSVKLGVEHVFAGLAAAMKEPRAELLVEKLTLGVLPQAEVARLQQTVLGGQRIKQGTVNPQPPPDEKGVQAYELAWSQRPAPPAQVTFDNLTGWTAQNLGDGAVTLSASKAQRLWRPTVGKLTIPNSDTAVAVVLSPPRPIPLGSSFDGANFWVYGPMHFMNPQAQPINVSAIVQDSRGAEGVVDLGPIRMGYWMLLHGNVPENQRKNWVPPLSFKALQLTADRAKADYTLYLEAVHFYERNRQPKSYGRPEKTVFPVNDNGFLPTPPAGVKVSAEKTAQGARLISAGPTGKLAFEINPQEGPLGGIVGRWNDAVPFQPCEGGGVLTAEGAILSGKLISSRLNGDRFLAQWQAEDGRRWQAEYALKGRTLLVDVSAPGGWSAGTSLGSVVGLPAVKAIEVPYLKLSRYGTMTHFAAGGGVFLSLLPDLYHSDYSSLEAVSVKPEGDRVRLLNKTTYTPLTNGKRNDLRDRLMITVSPEFADTLPNHQNPRSPNLERLAPYMFVMNRALALDRWETFKRYGLDHLIANDFAGIFVKDYSEGFGVRWRPHPDYTIEQVQAARQKIKDLGYLFGAYIDVTDWPPLNEWWDENQIALTSTGDLCEAWPGSYCPKWDFMWVLARRCGQKMKEHYPPDCVYLDVSTNRGSDAMDYEAGYPGAGMARQMMIGVGDSLVETRKWYGSTVSEGIYRWLYAGLSDMDYAQVRMSEGLPLPLDFDLLKIHPYQIGTMMGYGPTTLLSEEEVKKLHDGSLPQGPAFYKYVATSLAYGHSALLGYGYFPPMSACLAYYALMQGPQQVYLPDQVARIEYHDGERFLSTSEALQKAAHKLGRVRVTWRSGLVVTANLSPEKDWTVTQAGKEYLLPPNGWVISQPPTAKSGGMLSYSALVDGKRMDYAQTPEYEYLSGGELKRRVGALEVQGAAWLKRDGKGWLLIPCGKLGYWAPDCKLERIPPDRGTPTLIVDLGALGLKQPTVAAVGEMGEALPATTETLPDGRLKVTVTDQTRAFRLQP